MPIRRVRGGLNHSILLTRSPAENISGASRLQAADSQTADEGSTAEAKPSQAGMT